MYLFDLSMHKTLTDEERKVRKAASGKSYYEANKEKIAASQRAFRESNKEKIVAWQKAYYEANKEDEERKARKSAATKVWQEANKEKRAASGRAYYEANKEKIAARIKSYNKDNRAQRLASAARQRANLTMAYVANCLRMSVSAVTNDLVELKREQLQISRFIRKLNKLLSGGTNHGQ